MDNNIMRQSNQCINKTVEKTRAKLWHYTNFNALDGIMNNKEIWFSSVAGMNDKSESNDFIDKLERAVLEELEQNQSEKAKEVFDKIRFELKKNYPFIFCVSYAGDDAAQWERYANNGQGVALVFNEEILRKLMESNEFIVNDEYYEYDAKEHEMKQILLDYIRKHQLSGFLSLDGLIDNLLLCATIHKHQSFVSEKEVRIAPLFVEENDEHITYKIAGIIKKVYVVDLQFLCKKEDVKFTDLIEAIVIGPKSQQSIADLQWYLEKIGLQELVDKVNKSECPLR